MGATVFANSDGLFHKGSGGSGIAFPDVCLSPPPPPAGPIPIPYPNNVSAGDLSDGSKTVKIQGEPTALKDQSSVSTSTGDEGGTQGGNVVTHKTKGKGYFQLWSFDVKIEGKNACRHSDPLGQNCGSSPPGSLCPASTVAMKAWRDANNPTTKCKEKYDSEKHRRKPTADQNREVNKKKGRKKPRCWQCKSTSPMGWAKVNGRKVPAPNPGGAEFTADHQPPQVVTWYAGGCLDGELGKDPMGKYERQIKSKRRVKPHCQQCSPAQGGEFSTISSNLAKVHGL